MQNPIQLPIDFCNLRILSQRKVNELMAGYGFESYRENLPQLSNYQSILQNFMDSAWRGWLQMSVAWVYVGKCIKLLSTAEITLSNMVEGRQMIPSSDPWNLSGPTNIKLGFKSVVDHIDHAIGMLFLTNQADILKRVGLCGNCHQFFFRNDMRKIFCSGRCKVANFRSSELIDKDDLNL